MDFYGRQAQLAELRAIRDKAFKDHSRLTIVTGRRRIGKTTLVTQALEAKSTIYLFVAKKNESLLCADFVEEINLTIDAFVPPETSTFKSVFSVLFKLAEKQSFSLVIDEFQEFFNINPSFYSDLQNLWDQYRKKTKLNLVVCGSIYSLMQKIFRDEKEPLFGRADFSIKLEPFETSVLKEVMLNLNKDYSNEDLLALYAITGGVPKYVELFADNDANNLQKMVELMIREGSIFLDEGKSLLVEEVGKNYVTYFSILSVLSSGISTQGAIESALGGTSVGGHLKRLVEDYAVIERKVPILAKKGTKSVRYQICDNFLQFWFKYIDKHRQLIEIKNYPGLKTLIIEDFASYSGRTLERYFLQKLAESFEFSAIGPWWATNKEHCDIDIVAIYLNKKEALAIEVKRQAGKFQPELLHKRAKHLQDKALADYVIKEQCLSMSDM